MARSRHLTTVDWVRGEREPLNTSPTLPLVSISVSEARAVSNSCSSSQSDQVKQVVMGLACRILISSPRVTANSMSRAQFIFMSRLRATRVSLAARSSDTEHSLSSTLTSHTSPSSPVTCLTSLVPIFLSITCNDLTLGYQTSDSASSSNFHHWPLLALLVVLVLY